MPQINHICDYHEAGYRVFPLHSIVGGVCDCGGCDTAGKHPLYTAWQQVPVWSDEQFEVMLEHTVGTGFGVNVDQRLVVDVDPRNGGFESFDKLQADLGFDLIALSGFVVNTGGGGLHVYFDRPEGSYSTNLDTYRGIDFKTSGFVVGCGSLHASGLDYEIRKGSPFDTTPAPESLLELIKKRGVNRSVFSGGQVDLSDSEIADMLEFVSCFDDYDCWLKIGMAIHHATSGSGIKLWDAWSAKSSKYDPSSIEFKWASFGKSANPVTVGSLVYMAEAAGYVRPVTFVFEPPVVECDEKAARDLPFDVSEIDLLRPPGFVGQITHWINQQGQYLRERLAVITAITAVGNAGGLKYRDDVSGVTPNLLSICVAGTGTGKEQVQQCFSELMRAAGMAGALHGEIKSKQELIRNLLHHQASYYMTDELGEVLRAIENARKKGGAAYLEGIPGMVMSIFTKADSFLPVSGDVRREAQKELSQRIKFIRKAIENNEPGGSQGELESCIRLVELIEKQGGIPRPFLSLIGYSTLESLDGALSEEMAKNGFLNRAILIDEPDTNPKRSKIRNKHELPLNLALTMAQIASTGETERVRIEYYGKTQAIQTEPAGVELLDAISEWQWRFAEWHKEHTGYESLARRAYESISKISLILGIPGKLRTVEHIKWAAKMVKADIDEKIRLIRYVASKEHGASDEKKGDGMTERICSLAKDGIYRTTLIQRISGKFKSRKHADDFLGSLIEKGVVRVEGKKVVFEAF